MWLLEVMVVITNAKCDVDTHSLMFHTHSVMDTRTSVVSERKV
jgi:hypothetical protein